MYSSGETNPSFEFVGECPAVNLTVLLVLKKTLVPATCKVQCVYLKLIIYFTACIGFLRHMMCYGLFTKTGELEVP